MPAPAPTPAPGQAPTAAFFADLRAAYGARLVALQPHPQADLPAALLAQAGEAFEANLAIQAEATPPVACHRGCAACCSLRVTASAPELLLLARYLRATASAFARAGLDLLARLHEADAQTRGLDERARVGLRRRCAFVVQGVCAVYAVRPLACRGHAALDARACADAAAGRRLDVPYSPPHRLVRGVVQSALLSALRGAGLAWGLAELNAGLVSLLALPPGAADAAWRAGADPLAAVALPARELGQWVAAVAAHEAGLAAA